MRDTLLVVFVVFLAMVASFSTARAFEYSPFGLEVQVGGGVKWEHAHQGRLDFSGTPFIDGTLTKYFDNRWGFSGTLERRAVQEADYEVRGRVFYTLGAGRRY